MALAQAERHPLTQTVLREQLSRLGGTPFQLRTLDAQIDGQPMVPLSVLGLLRRELVAQLVASSRAFPHRPVRIGALAELQALLPVSQPEDPGPPALRVLCRSLAQLRTVLDCGVRSVMIDAQDIRDYRVAVREARRHGAEIYLATPRIQKPAEMGIFRALLKHQPSGMLVRNMAGVEFYAERDIPFVCDFSLNAANPLAVDYLRRCGAVRVTAAYDLNREQLLDLVSSVPAGWLEVVIHQHMPMFHMEHCVFCAVLSPGTNRTNCGRPCDVHDVQLRDRVGMEHPLKADVGCRNTLFNAVPQSAAESVPALLARGLRDFRIELLSADGADLRVILASYEELLAGRTTGQEVWKRLRAANRVGVTRGTLEERRLPLAIL
jgi:putative protease